MFHFHKGQTSSTVCCFTVWDRANPENTTVLCEYVHCYITHETTPCHFQLGGELASLLAIHVYAKLPKYTI